MVIDALRRLTSGPKPVILVFVLLLASLYLMSEATQNSAVFGRLYSLLLAVNILALVLLVALIVRQLIRLIRQYRENEPGSRLTMRLVVMFVVLALAPVTVVYYFSLEFLHRGIDSWFDVRVEKALEDSLELGRTALDARLREMLRQTRALSEELTDVPDGAAALRLNELRERSHASEMTLLTTQRRVIASSSSDQAGIVPNLPNQAILVQLSRGFEFAAVEPVGDKNLQVRVAVPVPASGPADEPRVLHALYPVAERLGGLAESVQSAFAQYKELAFLRWPLKSSFTLTLSLVLLLSLLTAVWAAFYSARRLVAPIRDLAEGTRAVAAGDYDKRLPLPGRDELGYLVRSFNEMTRKIALARDQAQRSQREVEAQHTYLETVLGRLSSGVLTIDGDHSLRTLNAAASQILGIDPTDCVGRPWEELPVLHTALEPFVDTIAAHLSDSGQEWRAEVVLFGPGGRQVLMCRGAALAGAEAIPGGHVIVFDDVTTLIQAQRDAAWGEVARRLAHEIKNPLTPIQLSAERLRHKYLKTMNPADAEVLDRSTHTIVQQVEAMKEMVKAFSEYARPPRMELADVDLNTLVKEVLDLYHDESRHLRLTLRLDPNLPLIQADAGRLRQLIHNLTKNALEAGGRDGMVRLDIGTHATGDPTRRSVELQVRDNGPGIPDALFSQLFEPYVTTKPKGTGLGLAIVKKIVEEHGGVLWAENAVDGGACVTIRLPARPEVGRGAKSSPGWVDTGGRNHHPPAGGTGTAAQSRRGGTVTAENRRYD